LERHHGLSGGFHLRLVSGDLDDVVEQLAGKQTSAPDLVEVVINDRVLVQLRENLRQ
jgi:hypothetical protein